MGCTALRVGSTPLPKSCARAGGEPFSLPARTPEDRDPERPMKNRLKPKKEREQEAVGIVISEGPVREAPPLISAYVWGPAPGERETRPSRRQPNRVPATTV
jgi:hypothetical protein